MQGFPLHLNRVRLMHTTYPGGMVSFPVAGGSVKFVVMVLFAGYRYAATSGNVTPAAQASTWNSSSGCREH